MKTDEFLWQSLRKGDRVRIVHLPNEYSKRNYSMHEETRATHQHLVKAREVLTVNRIDSDGFPWVEFSITADDGITYHHELLLNHDGIVLDAEVA